jgi:type IV secretory pathway VirB3-like protein
MHLVCKRGRVCCRCDAPIGARFLLLLLACASRYAASQNRAIWRAKAYHSETGIACTTTYAEQSPADGTIDP